RAARLAERGGRLEPHHLRHGGLTRRRAHGRGLVGARPRAAGRRRAAGGARHVRRHRPAQGVERVMSLERLQIDAGLSAYIDDLLAPPASLQELYRENAGDPWAEMMTPPELGRLLAVLVRATGGRAVLEVGTFVGVSATWMA